MSGNSLHIKHNFVLGLDWLQEMANDMGATLMDEKLLILPDHIGKGSSFFLEVAPGFSLLLTDVAFNIPISFTRKEIKDNFYQVYYDLSDELNNYSLRLFISKQLLMSLMGNNKPQEVIEVLFDDAQNTLFFYSHIDSSTRILLKKLKERSFDDPSFELLAKGNALKILTHLVRRIRNLEPIIQKLSPVDTSGVLSTRQYLLDNLLLDFPGVARLANMAGMSESKYRKLFRKIIKSSPNSFFLQEKMLLAQNLLQSGNFNSIREVALEVGYSKAGYFAGVYKKTFGTLPQAIFVKAI